MPSEKVLELKKQQVAALKERLDASIAGVVVDYKGIQKVGHLLAEKCKEFYPIGFNGVEFEFDNFNVKVT